MPLLFYANFVPNTRPVRVFLFHVARLPRCVYDTKIIILQCPYTITRSGADGGYPYEPRTEANSYDNP